MNAKLNVLKTIEQTNVRSELKLANPDALETHEERIRITAYLRAEHRGFAPGYEVSDWVEAEAEINSRRS